MIKAVLKGFATRVTTKNNKGALCNIKLPQIDPILGTLALNR